MLTIGITIISGVVVVSYNIRLQKTDAHNINLSGKQRLLSQYILNQVFFIERNKKNSLINDPLNKLKELTNELETTQHYLASKNRNEENIRTIDSVFEVVEPYHSIIVASSKEILNNPKNEVIQNSLRRISEAEIPFLSTMNLIVNTYEEEADRKLQRLINVLWILASIILLILFGESVFVMTPVIKELLQNNKELINSNEELAKSEHRIKKNMLELTKLKTDLEVKEAYNKIFIEQAPTAIAMLDKNMRYMAVSQRWIIDYKMEGKEIIGQSHYDLFPEIGDDWKANHQKSLNGFIDSCDEAPFKRADGSVQWIFWDVRPWYISEGQIGGLLMHTGDITDVKEKDKERERIEEILEKTNEIARIGTWEMNVTTGEYTLSKITCEILKLPENFKAFQKDSMRFYKKGASRDKIIKSTTELIESGIPFDIELEMITQDGKSVYVRKIGQTESEEGVCRRIFGIFQDISEQKLAENKFKGLLESAPDATVIVNEEGKIQLINKQAEKLFGYQANELFGESVEVLIPKRFTGTHAAHRDGFFSNPKARKMGEGKELYGINKKGEEIPIQISLSPLQTEDGLLVSAAIRDITAQKLAENELLKKNQLLNFAEEINMMGHWQWNTVADKVKWSNNLFKMFELEEATTDMKFDSYFNFVHPDDKEIVTEYFKKAAIDKKFESFTHRIITTTGQIKTVQLMGQVFTNEMDEIVEMIGTGQDITEQKMAENKFRGLLESAPDAMVIVNQNGAIDLINKQAEKLFGYTAKELIGNPVEMLIPKRFLGNHTTYRDDFFTKPKTRPMGEGKELFGINKKGEEIPIQISLGPLKTEEGMLVSVAIRDITNQKLAERKIIEAKENLEVFSKKLVAQNTQLADFTHITSHNLRAPVSNLNSLLDFYKISDSEEEKIDLFETDKALEEISFQNILNKTKEILSGEIIKSKVVVTSNFSEIENITYNRIYLESIFLNLVGNAIKYKSEDRVPELFIESEIKDGKIKVKFKDNGLGIDLERHGHKLFGLNKVFHRHPDAKGVGLFMTKTQIEAMGGIISATSKVNEGTTFIINFN